MRPGRIVPLLIALTFLTLAFRPVQAQPVASSSDISSIGSGLQETTYGDLAADALRDATGVDLVFVPSSALRPVILPSAGLTTEKIAGVLVATTAPANAYVTMRLKGRQILAALERSVSHLPESFDGYLQVSGLKIVYDPSKSEGSRIVSITLLNGQRLDPESQYLAAMTQPLGLGGMGYFQAWNQSDIIKTSDGDLASVISAYAVAHQPLAIRTDGRLASQ